MPAPRHIDSHAALRGIAALLVVGYHLQFGATYLLPLEQATAFLQRSYLFVDLFFVLSGFIISYVNDATRSRSVTKAEVSSFLRARAARLYPLHLFVLAYFLVARIAISALQIAMHRSPDQWDGHSLLSLASQIVLLNAWFPKHPQWNIPSWSISAEFFVYALFPLIVNFHVRSRRLCKATLLLFPLAFYGYILMTTKSLDIVVGLAPARCVAGFSLGMLVYFGREAIDRLPTLALTLLQVLATGTIILFLAKTVPDPWIVPAFVVLVGTTWTDRGLVPHLLRNRPLLWLGDISYSVYLNHVCLISISGFFWARTVQHFAGDGALNRLLWIGFIYTLVIGVSYLTYNWVERPARQWLAKRWLGHRAPSIVTSPAAP